MSSCTLALQIMTDTDSFTHYIIREPGYLGRPDSGLSRWSDVCIRIPIGRYNMTFHAVGCLGDRIQITDVTVGTRGCGRCIIYNKTLEYSSEEYRDNRYFDVGFSNGYWPQLAVKRLEGTKMNHSSLSLIAWSDIVLLY